MLRDFKPDATIDVMVFSEAAAQALQNNSTINAVHVRCNKRQFLLLAPTYDAVICLRNSRDTKKCADWFDKTILCPRPSDDIHLNMQAVVFLCNLLNIPAISLSDNYLLSPQSEDYRSVERVLLREGASLAGDEMLIGIHMGCRHIAKRGLSIWRSALSADKTKSWPFENFAQLIKSLINKCPATKIVLTGVPSENGLVKQYLHDVPNLINLIGQTSVLETAALMRYLRVFLTGDTGPLHIAATTKVPIVALFSRTDPKIFGPYPPRNDHTILYEPNMVDITVARVEKAVTDAL